MANFNPAITLGSTTRTVTKDASAANINRFVAALRLRYPAAASDNAAVDLFLGTDVVALARQITLFEERKAAAAANVDTIAEIAIT